MCSKIIINNKKIKQSKDKTNRIYKQNISFSCLKIKTKEIVKLFFHQIASS